MDGIPKSVLQATSAPEYSLQHANCQSGVQRDILYHFSLSSFHLSVGITNAMSAKLISVWLCRQYPAQRDP